MITHWVTRGNADEQKPSTKIFQIENNATKSLVGKKVVQQDHDSNTDPVFGL